MTSSIDHPDQKPTHVRYCVLTWLSVAAVLAYFARNCVGVAESTIRSDLELTKAESGWFLSAFFWSYALFQIPTGFLGRRYGTRFVLAWSAILWSVSLLLLACANNLSLLIASQLLAGIAQAAVFPCAVQSLSDWFPEPRRATACSALATGMQIGAVLTASLTGYLIVQWDWWLIFALYAAPGLLWAILFVDYFYNWPEEDPNVNRLEIELIQAPIVGQTGRSKTIDNTRPTPWGLILTNRSVLCLCGQQALRAAGYGFFATWFPTFLQESRNIDVGKSGVFQGLVFAANLFGGLSGGLLVDRIYARTRNLKASRSGVGALCMLLCGGLIFSANLVASDGMAVMLIAIGAYAAALAGPCAYVATIDLGKQHVSAVFPLMNMSGNLLSALALVLLGYLFDQTKAWNIVLPLFGIAYLLAAICWWFVDPNDTVESRELLEEVG